MKLHFEPNLDFQHDAIEAVCDLFRGQETGRSEFTVTRGIGLPLRLPEMASALGIGNRLHLRNEEILANLHAVQLRNGLPLSPALASADFTVEMETGTGKTYVYLRTIFELNRCYGFTKFVVVVPSVAVKEGVYKTLHITADHLRALYANVPFEYFLYDSGRLGQVWNFAASPYIQIMVVTVGAINKKDVNNLYKESEKTGGEKPIDLIRSTRPILIVDEPQSVDGGLQGQGRQALDAMHPLCTLRYSATHVDQHHMVYRLDAVDAYERKLVKQIEVAAASVAGGHNRPYLRLLAVTSQRGAIAAKVELDVATATGVQRREMTVRDGDSLERITGRAVYHDCRVGELRVGVKPSRMYPAHSVCRSQRHTECAGYIASLELHVPGGVCGLKVGQAHGDVEPLALQREMIRRTIREHFDKELRLVPLGIKVLTLFFIDAVERYRRYDADGQPVKGDYALIFEEEYRRLAAQPDYRGLFQGVDASGSPLPLGEGQGVRAEEAHDGYFSIDKKGGWTDTAENNQADRDNAQRAYSLIMRDKEKLLSFDTRLKFIFSHSALKEGWDNPNVFQICALREMGSERERRQTIGRGLRLCVNQQGERLRGFDVNTLTVIAAEGYEQFAENLQKEIETDVGIRFGVVEKHQFTPIAVVDDQGRATALGVAQSEAIWKYLQEAGHLDTHGKIQDRLRTALKEDCLQLPEQFQAQLPQVREVLRKLAGKVAIRNADERKTVRTGQPVLPSEELQALWDRVRQPTTCRVYFDNERLIQDCIRAIADAPPIARTRLVWRKADLAIGRSGIAAAETATSAPLALGEGEVELPDLLTDLRDKTRITRRSLVRILTGSGRLDDFRRNPQEFVELAAEAINRAKRMALVPGIKHERRGGQEYYIQELFGQEELDGYLKNESVKVYAKLPTWFMVLTPLGDCNPDRAVLVQADGAERLFFGLGSK